MAGALRIAIAQSRIDRDVRANGREIRGLVRRAAAGGARLVQFPEGAASGYCKSEIASWDEVDWPALREELEETAALAGSLGLWVVLGSAHPLTAPHRPHNSLYVIADTGALVGRYDKRRCSHSEVSDWFAPGEAPLTFAVDGFTFGCALCIETVFPEVFSEYETLGADAVLVSSYSRDPIYGVLARAHAASTCLWIGLAIPAQCSQPLPSSLIAPNGVVLGEAGRDGESGLVFGTLDRGEPAFAVALEKARPWRRTARLGDIYESRRVDDPRSHDRFGF
ncbi:carbon-nitrogen hydrolase family protein [Mycobacterium sp. KBS0706]|uniref:carbon-nitrogen hydrolase family protein n=1 Tax=Mycobacterium sp. KBS0706 TaxID=2578109 RepID=UPI00110FE9BC|nr:carbon-nitrogen hydrolase family protein [Mycobacterium sp. KBS0706]TSD88505.1 carbon-nitrogen hydrolase family protein [Mycobacterium sp. KBS0706]